MEIIIIGFTASSAIQNERVLGNDSILVARRTGFGTVPGPTWVLQTLWLCRGRSSEVGLP